MKQILFSCSIKHKKFPNVYEHISLINENVLTEYLLNSAGLTNNSGDIILWHIGTTEASGIIEIGSSPSDGKISQIISWEKNNSSWNNVIDLIMMLNESGMSNENLAKLKIYYQEGYRAFNSSQYIDSYLSAKKNGLVWNNPDFHIIKELKRRNKEKMFIEFNSNLYKNDPHTILNLIPVDEIKNIKLHPKEFRGKEEISNDIIITMNNGEEYSYSASSYKKAEKLFSKLKKSLKLVKL